MSTSPSSSTSSAVTARGAGPCQYFLGVCSSGTLSAASSPLASTPVWYSPSSESTTCVPESTSGWPSPSKSATTSRPWLALRSRAAFSDVCASVTPERVVPPASRMSISVPMLALCVGEVSRPS